MNSKLFIINGSPESGKDTFVDFVINRSDLNILNVRSSDHIKKVATSLGWDGIKNEKGRLFLFRLMKASRDYNDGVVKFYSNLITEYFCNHKESVIFLHVREPLEIRKYLKLFHNCKTVFIKRGSVKEFNNDSDTDVFLFNYDIIISNDSDLNNLEEKALGFIKKEIQ